MGGFLPLLRDGEVILLISPPLLAELVDVAERAKFRKHFPVAIAHELAMSLADLGQHVDVEAGSRRELSRDPKDDYLLVMAEKAKADVLVTGDTDLLVLERFKDTVILNAKSFTDTYLK
ncbi:MAG: putative toxin-antitoxin system toxin component, PIN family [Flavobacteriales bacterium]